MMQVFRNGTFNLESRWEEEIFWQSNASNSRLAPRVFTSGPENVKCTRQIPVIRTEVYTLLDQGGVLMYRSSVTLSFLDICAKVAVSFLFHLGPLAKVYR